MTQLSQTQVRADKWSKCTLIGAVLLFAYSFFALLTSVHMDRKWHQRQHRFSSEEFDHKERESALLVKMNGAASIAKSSTAASIQQQQQQKPKLPAVAGLKKLKKSDSESNSNSHSHSKGHRDEDDDDDESDSRSHSAAKKMKKGLRGRKSDSDSESNSNSNSHSHSKGHGDRESDSDSNSNSNSHSKGRRVDKKSNSDSDSNSNSNSHSKGRRLGKKSHSDSDSRSHSHSHSFHRFESEGACRLHHFAILGLITSLTGIISSFKMRRGWAFAFLILVLITEVSALGFVGYKNAKAVSKCTARATEETLQVQETTLKINSNIELRHDAVVSATFNVNQAKLDRCQKHVKHASVIACLMIGVIACALACCGSRFSNALGALQEEQEKSAELEETKNESNTCCVDVSPSSPVHHNGDEIQLAVIVNHPHNKNNGKEEPVLIIQKE